MTHDIAWAAGLFEGEGCWRGRPSRGDTGAALGMKDRDVVEHFRDVVGFGSIHQRATGLYVWSCGGFQWAQAFGAMFWPWLGERRRARWKELILLTRPRYQQTHRRPAGHPFEGSNILLDTGGKRRCRTCRQAYWRRAYARRKERGGNP